MLTGYDVQRPSILTTVPLTGEPDESCPPRYRRTLGWNKVYRVVQKYSC